MAKILIADDEQDIRDLLTWTLKFAGHEVVVASDGEEAFRLARQEQPELALLDVRMPKMNGYEACRQIKADPALKHMPVVFVSAWGQESEVKLGMEAGAAGYVIKPFEPNMLILKVAELVAKKP
jgi:DNA-binding response OmpR family regulator